VNFITNYTWTEMLAYVADDASITTF